MTAGPPHAEEVTLGGVAMRYRWDGPAAAPPLVLANSLGTTTGIWDAQLPALAGHFRVLRYEHRGHGGLPAPPGPYSIEDLGGDLLALLGHLGVEQASVAGLSLGGMVALWLAAEHPERVDRLALLCTAPSLPPAGPWRERAARVRSEGTAFLVDALMARWLSPGVRPDRPGLRSDLEAMLGAADSAGYAGCCEAIAGADLGPRIPSITAPTLVLAGSADTVCPPAVALQMNQSLTNSSLNVVAGGAHLANVDQPDAVNEALVFHLLGSRTERAERKRRAVLGDSHVGAVTSVPCLEDRFFNEVAATFAWCDVWGRPGLDTMTRSRLTVAVLAALGREELVLHLAAARRLGIPREEIAEILLHVGLYAGVPAAHSALAVARRVFDGDDEIGARST